MPPKCETRAGKARASRNEGGDRFRDAHTLEALQAQILILKAGIRPELAATLAGLVFGGAA